VTLDRRAHTPYLPYSEKNAQPPRRQGYQDSKLLLSKPKGLMAPCGASALLIGRLPSAHPIWCSWRLGGSRISD